MEIRIIYTRVHLTGFHNIGICSGIFCCHLMHFLTVYLVTGEVTFHNKQELPFGYKQRPPSGSQKRDICTCSSVCAHTNTWESHIPALVLTTSAFFTQLYCSCYVHPTRSSSYCSIIRNAVLPTSQ